MIIDKEIAVKLEGRDYPGIKELGFTDDGSFIASLYTLPKAEQGHGGYWTSFPISPANYRKTHPTKTSVRDFGEYISIADDWGHCHKIESSRDVLDILLNECKQHNIPLIVGET